MFRRLVGIGLAGKGPNVNRRLRAGLRRAGVAVAGLCVALAGSGLTPAAAAPSGAKLATAPVRAGGADPSFTFGFSGATQSLTVPANVIVMITADGAGGADNTGTSCSVTGTGGSGARVVTTLLPSASPTTFTINVGGTGGKGCNGTGVGGAGGFNGGGSGGSFPQAGFQWEGPGGGGASSVSAAGSFVVVAGGGGAAGGTGVSPFVSSTGGNGGTGGAPDATGATAGSATGDSGVASPGQGGGGGSTSTSTGGGGGNAGTAPLCHSTNGGPGGGFAGVTVGSGGTGGSLDGGCTAATGSGGGGGGGYFAGGGGGAATVNDRAVVAAAGGGGGGGGSSFATPTGTGTSFSLSPIGTANSNGQVVISYFTPSTTMLTASPNPAVVGQPVTLTATVTCSLATPTGSATFFDGATPITGLVPLNASGTATFTTSSLAIGSHPLTAKYSGDTNCSASTSDTVVEVIQQGTSTTTLTPSSTNPGFGQPVTLTAHVTCTAGIPPTGTVTFFEGATPIGMVPVNGSGNASLTVNGLAAGSHAFTAHYDGDTNCAGSTSSAVTVTVGCQTISGTHLGPLAVTGPVCLTPGSQVLGPVTITGTGSLDAEGATIQGLLTATSGTGLRMCTSTVTGPVNVSGMNGVIIIGETDGTPPCGPNTMRGPVTISGNTGFVELDGNQILGPVTVTNNHTTITSVPPENATATEIEANRIVGFLACVGNTPPPTNNGHRNTVIGIRSGQCATL